MPRPIVLVVSVDTEEDNWRPCRDGVTVENIRELPRLDALVQRLGVRATYFTTYQVASHGWAAATLRRLHEGGAEIGAHLHPWNTPPLEEPFLPRNTMLKNLAPPLQLAKLERLTTALREAPAFSRSRSGRAGSGRAGKPFPPLFGFGSKFTTSLTPSGGGKRFKNGLPFFGPRPVR